jgi:hypothetical protein
LIEPGESAAFCPSTLAVWASGFCGGMKFVRDASGVQLRDVLFPLPIRISRPFIFFGIDTCQLAHDGMFPAVRRFVRQAEYHEGATRKTALACGEILDEFLCDLFKHDDITTSA